MKMYSGTRYASGKNFNYYKKPFYKTKGFYLLILILIGIVSFIVWSIKRTEQNETTDAPKYSDESTVPTLSAKVMGVTGKVESLSPGSDWVETAENYQLKNTESIRTDAESKVIIELPDGSLLRLNENSEVELAQIGLADIIINQKRGEVFHRVNDQSPAIYRVRNNNVELTALGTAFNIIIDGQTTKLVVTENKVKAKVYRDEDILNMRTIDEGTEAIINPNLAVDKMIDSKTIDGSELLGQSWYAWNIEQDTAKNLYLGLFAKATKLVILEPEQSEMSTDKDAIMIKGATDPAAEIFIDGQELENKNGSFEMNYKLGAKLNEITITVKKDKNINKKILKITSTKTPDELKLSGSLQEKNINLTWTSSELKDIAEIKILMSKKTGTLTYPAEQEHSVKISNTKDSWNNLDDGQYFFRLCAYEEASKSCRVYSNQITLTVNSKLVAEEPPAETPATKPEVDNSKGYILLSGDNAGTQVTLNWLISDFTAENGVYILKGSTSNLLYPAQEKISLTSGSSYTWSNLTSGQTYYFRVCENLTNKCGRYSNEYSVTIK